MPFLLSVESHPNGFSQVVYDAGVTRRVNLYTLTENLHTTLGVPADALLASLTSETRPPDRRRSRP